MDEEMKRKCYERYKLRWMEEHGHGMNDLVEALRASEAQRIADGDRPTNVVDCSTPGKRTRASTASSTPATASSATASCRIVRT